VNGPASTATRKSTRRSIPRTAGLSGSSRVWFMRRKPNDSTVALISGLAPIVLFIRVALIMSGTRSPSGGWAPPLLRSWDPSRYGGGVGRLPTLWGGAAGALVDRGQALAHHLLEVTAAQL